MSDGTDEPAREGPPSTSGPGRPPPRDPPAPMPPVQPATDARRGAGLGRRFGAKFLDALVVGIPLMGLRAVIGLEVEAYLSAVIQAVAFLGYAALLESSTGRTLGKQVFGLRVRDETGAAPTLRAAAIRNAYWLFQLIPAATLATVLSLLAWLSIAVSTAASPGNRGVHDRLAGTTVVRAAR